MTPALSPAPQSGARRPGLLREARHSPRTANPPPGAARVPPRRQGQRAWAAGAALGAEAPWTGGHCVAAAAAGFWELLGSWEALTSHQPGDPGLSKPVKWEAWRAVRGHKPRTAGDRRERAGRDWRTPEGSGPGALVSGPGVGPATPTLWTSSLRSARTSLVSEPLRSPWCPHSPGALPQGEGGDPADWTASRLMANSWLMSSAPGRPGASCPGDLL